jgi:hypothetical protein
MLQPRASSRSWFDGTVSAAEPLRPIALETVLYEPDQQAVLAVLPGGLWLSPGDIVELDDPPRDARVLSTRLQLRSGEARVLIVLDVPDDPDAALRGDVPTEMVLGTDADEPVLVSDVIDDELELLTEEVDVGAAPDEGVPTRQ